MKSKNVYPIMREFHKWEKDPHVISACEKLVQVMCNFINFNLKEICQVKCNLYNHIIRVCGISQFVFTVMS